MKKNLLRFYIKLRWLYFHVNPNYIKFGMGGGSNEYHFQNIKKNTIHSNYEVVDRPNNDE